MNNNLGWCYSIGTRFIANRRGSPASMGETRSETAEAEAEAVAEAEAANERAAVRVGR